MAEYTKTKKDSHEFTLDKSDVEQLARGNTLCLDRIENLFRIKGPSPDTECDAGISLDDTIETIRKKTAWIINKFVMCEHFEYPELVDKFGKWKTFNIKTTETDVCINGVLVVAFNLGEWTFDMPDKWAKELSELCADKEDITKVPRIGYCKCRLVEIPGTEVHPLDKVNATILAELNQVLTRYRSDVVCYSGAGCRNCALSIVIDRERYCFSETIQNAAYRKKNKKTIAHIIGIC